MIRVFIGQQMPRTGDFLIILQVLQNGWAAISLIGCGPSERLLALMHAASWPTTRLRWDSSYGWPSTSRALAARNRIPLSWRVRHHHSSTKGNEP
jgi:hypothetical protein